LVEQHRLRGLYVGRFQPFHIGHAEVIRSLLAKVDELVIIIGSAQKSHELDNPFTAGERYMMIKDALGDLGVLSSRYHLIPVPDSPMHSIWVAQVVSYSPPFDIVFSNDPLTRRLFKELRVPVEPVKFYRRDIFSATEVRKRMLEGGNWQELVPRSVANHIERIKGVERLRELALSDSPYRVKATGEEATL
jgi:nicotinamide-nucleotide adenylyltransferase